VDPVPPPPPHYANKKKRGTWEIPEVGDKISFKTSEHQNGLVAPSPEDGRRRRTQKMIFLCMFDENTLRVLLGQDEDCRIFVRRLTNTIELSSSLFFSLM
jgi:hypothetical protein